jgi:hypothetical protein
LRQSLSNLSKSTPHYVVAAGVVIWSLPEHFDADRALFQAIGATLQSALRDVSQKAGVAAAITKCPVLEDAFKLVPNDLRVRLQLRRSRVVLGPHD